MIYERLSWRISSLLGLMAMRLLAVTDFHGATTAIRRASEKAAKEKLDLIIVCGDVTHFGSYDLAKEFLKLLAKSKCPVLFVPGNCDPSELVQGVRIRGVSNLHGTCKVQNDLCFVGVGGSPPSPFFTLNEFSEERILGTLENAYGEVDETKKLILVSHSPPYNTRLDATSLGKHVGSRAVRRFIEDKKPILAVCGHIHEARGVDRLGSTAMVNPGPASRGYCAKIAISRKINVQLDVL
jgi:hypothetical protein